MIVIHIGMPKAGSTTIQHFLRDNDDALRQLSIDYPRVGRENPNHNLNHRNFANEILGRDRRIHAKSSSLAGLIRHIADVKYQTTVLSSEELCRAREMSIRRVHEVFSQIDIEIRVILIIRDLVELIPSAYAQSIRYGASTDDFDTFFNFRAANENLTPFNVAERWANVFGWPAICVRLLSPPALRGADLIEDFMATAGLNPDDSQLAALPRPARANESSGWKTLEAVRAFFGGRSALDRGHALFEMGTPKTPRRRKDYGYAAEAAGRELGWQEDRGRYLTRAQATFCEETYVSSLRRLNERFGYRLPAPVGLTARDFAERPFLPDASRINPAELKAFYDAWAERM